MKKILFTLLFIPTLGFSQYTAIPDAVFEQWLIDNSYDNVIDGQVLTTNISGVTSLYFQWNNNNIPLDLTGIQDFTSLTSLTIEQTTFSYCGYCINNLDLSGLTSLNSVSINGNQLTTLDVSGCSALTTLQIRYNQLTSLNVSGCTALSTLSLESNQLTTLDVSSCTALSTLKLQNNQIATLDLSNNNLLNVLMVGGFYYQNNTTGLAYGGNLLSTLDLSQNTLLSELNCQNNQLSTLDLSQNTLLTELYCQNNQLASLDLSGCNGLTQLGAYNNQLTCLSLKNGNNYNMTLDATNNSGLSCIEVDDPNWSTSNWTTSNNSINGGVIFSSNCNYPIGCGGANCNEIIVYDTTTILVSDTQFQSQSPDYSLIVSDTFPQLNYPDCDSIIMSYNKYIFSSNDTLYIDITVTGFPSVDNTISVYPNPANDVVIIDNGNYSAMSNYSLVIINSLSQQVFSSQINTQQFQIPVSTLGAEGTYFIQIFDGNNNLVIIKYLVLN